MDMSNLRAEMARNRIRYGDVAEIIGKSERSVRDKISGKRDFTVSEAFAIRRKLFRDLTIEYLFSDTGQ